MSSLDIIIIVIVLLGAVAAGLYFLNRWASRRMDDQQRMIEQNKTSANIFVIDKKKDKPENANLPKAAISQMNRLSKMMKMHFVKAKVGPQVLTLMCDKKVFEALPVKRNVTVDLAGIYIVGMKGMKSDEEIKAIKKAKKQKAKAEKAKK